MRRLLAVLMAAATILVPTVAQASTGWARYEGKTWVRWTSPVELPRLAEDLTPAARVALLEYLRARDLAIDHAKKAHAQYVADRRAAELRAQTPAVHGSSGGGGTESYHGSVAQLVARMFAARGQDVHRALCTAYRESHFDPSARNPSSGAAGVFQIMPSNWPRWSVWAGYSGASVYSAVANIGTAAYIVQHYGWSPWSGGCG